MIYSNNWNVTLPSKHNFDLPIKDIQDKHLLQKQFDLSTPNKFSEMLAELALHINSIDESKLLAELALDINSIDESKLNDAAFLNLQIKKASKKLIQNSIKSYDIDDFYSPNGKIPFPKEKNPYIQFQDDIF
jgi:hypothetical protein